MFYQVKPGPHKNLHNTFLVHSKQRAVELQDELIRPECAEEETDINLNNVQEFVIKTIKNTIESTIQRFREERRSVGRPESSINIDVRKFVVEWF